MPRSAEMQFYSARLESFERPQQLVKRRASSQSTRRRNGSTVEWPHTQPTPEDLARAGFFFSPSQDNPDNVECFTCAVKLDGWEKEDDPVSEHLAHFPTCSWAIANSVAPRVDREENRDPMDEGLIAARTETFSMGEGWIHEKKRGWKCKTKRLVEAGWCYDPAPGVEDGTTCFYCNLSLDGWEPKDDPLEEHRKREPECPFFTLSAKFGSTAGSKAKGKGKGKTKAVRGSAASAASSRISAQSALSTFSDLPSLADSGDDIATADDSILTTATSASSATTKSGKRKATRPKATAKATKGKKRSTVTAQSREDVVQYPNLSHAVVQDDPMDVDTAETVPAAKPARKTKRAARGSQQVDSSALDVSTVDHAPKKTTRGRAAKAQPAPVATPEPEDYNLRNSEASAQLLDELEQSLAEPDHEATPQPMSAPRGTKRTSDGLPKHQDSSVIEIEPPVKKTTMGSEAKGQTTSPVADDAEALLFSPNTSMTEYPWVTGQFPQSESELDQPKKAAKGKKAAVSKKTKAKKTSSARSSKATVIVTDSGSTQQDDEDLARDEREIEAELERIAAEAKAAEDAVRSKTVPEEPDQAAEFEPSPTRPHKPAKQQDDVLPDVVMSNTASAPAETISADAKATPSPTGSDKENNPSVVQPSAKPMTTVYTSPTKTTRIPLAPGTPNMSPRKIALTSPSKQFSRLTSANPWTAVELDTVLFASPEASPGTLGRRLADAAGTLTTPERRMTVEEWIRHNAAQGEEQARQRCEQMVSRMEREGMQALQTLEGISTS